MHRIKRLLPSVLLIIVLAVLVMTQIATTVNLRSQIYTDAQQRALSRQRSLNLIQAVPKYNAYVGDQLLESDDLTGAGPQGATMGATRCRVRATLDARYEDVEGITTTLYDLDFEGAYTIRYAGQPATTTLELIFPFPTGLDTLNQVYFLVDGEEPQGVGYSLDNITWRAEMRSGEEKEVVVRYRARGVGSFRYALDRNRRLEDLDVEIAVRGLEGTETPEGTLPTTAVDQAEDGELFTWHYEALIANRDVQIKLPERPSFMQRVEQLQGSLRSLSSASPLLVALFVACLAGAHRLTGVRLPFQHYVLAALGYFLFYPALTFLSGAVELPWAAAIALVLVTGLLIVFVARAAGRQTWWQTLLLCAVFLGLLSLGTMSRWRGLLMTAGGGLLVGLFMMLMARHRPTEPEPPAAPEQDPDEGDPDPEPPAFEVTFEPEPVDDPADPAHYCPHCGGPLAHEFSFCPACGQGTDVFQTCAACGAEHYVPAGAELDHCPACGSRLGN